MFIFVCDIVFPKREASGIYAVEMAGRVYVFRMDVFRTGMLFDFLIVISSVTKHSKTVAQSRPKVLADVGLLILDLTIGKPGFCDSDCE